MLSEAKHLACKGRFEMKLYLVQRAKTASKETDPQRPLTEEGRRDIQKVAAFIKFFAFLF
jgi:phosphohistidine phosphatase SixA